MTHQNPASTVPTIRIGDLYYVLFRHKWKILLISLIGVGIASYLYFTGWELKWESTAKLLVKFVVEQKQPTASLTEGVINVQESPIMTELQILTSVDVTQEAAQELARSQPGVLARLIGAKGSTNNSWDQAVGPIRNGLSCDVPRGTSVIEVSFKHPDSEVVRPVLDEIIRVYLQKHMTVHQGEGLYDRVLENQTSTLKDTLRDTENRLRAARAKVKVVSLEDAKKFNMDQIQKVRQKIFEAETDLAVSHQTIAMILASRNGTNSPVALTNMSTRVPEDKATDYVRIRAQLESLQKREQEALAVFTPASTRVRDLRDQMNAVMKEKTALEAEFPSLALTRVEGENRSDPLAQATLATNVISTRIKSLQFQEESYRKDLKELEAAEAEINELQRDKERQEQNFKYFSMTWDQTQANARMRDAGNTSITKIQVPSMPSPASSKRQKTIGMILLGCIGGALALAFALEFVVDRSFRRPVEVERQLGVPLFISIPRMKLNGHPKPMLPGSTKLIADANGEPPLKDGERKMEVAKRPKDQTPWEPSPALCPFSETLRDRLITYFEMKNMTHKPKLVAITSCGEGAGVSTVSAGLAASLSETGEGNVLLVDMNMKNGIAHQFHRGELAYGIDEALEKDKREGAMVQEKLYLASESGQKDSMQSVLPQRFKNLVPKLKASDYDYIIFDMPPVSQISMTPRLAKFMDMVLMVVESEKTDRDVVKRATTLLAESKTNVGVVLNKSKRYVPKALQQELA